MNPILSIWTKILTRQWHFHHHARIFKFSNIFLYHAKVYQSDNIRQFSSVFDYVRNTIVSIMLS